MLIDPDAASAKTTAAPLHVADAVTDCTPVANAFTVVVPAMLIPPAAPTVIQ